MLETLRAFGAGLLAEAGEADTSRRAGRVRGGWPGRPRSGLHTTHLGARRAGHLDAEDATLRQALDWALGHDPGYGGSAGAGPVGSGGRSAGAWPPRRRCWPRRPSTSRRAAIQWCVARMCLGQAAAQSGDPAGALALFTAARDTLLKAPRPVTLAQHVVLMICLFGRSSTLLYLDRVPEAGERRPCARWPWPSKRASRAWGQRHWPA